GANRTIKVSGQSPVLGSQFSVLSFSSGQQQRGVTHFRRVGGPTEAGPAIVYFFREPAGDNTRVGRDNRGGQVAPPRVLKDISRMRGMSPSSRCPLPALTI